MFLLAAPSIGDARLAPSSQLLRAGECSYIGLQCCLLLAIRCWAEIYGIRRACHRCDPISFEMDDGKASSGTALRTFRQATSIDHVPASSSTIPPVSTSCHRRCRLFMSTSSPRRLVSRRSTCDLGFAAYVFRSFARSRAAAAHDLRRDWRLAIFALWPVLLGALMPLRHARYGVTLPRLARIVALRKSAESLCGAMLRRFRLYMQTSVVRPLRLSHLLLARPKSPCGTQPRPERARRPQCLSCRPRAASSSRFPLYSIASKPGLK